MPNRRGPKKEGPLLISNPFEKLKPHPPAADPTMPLILR